MGRQLLSMTLGMTPGAVEKGSLVEGRPHVLVFALEKRR